MGAAAPAAAQSTGQGQQQQVKTDWSEQKLDAFAEASVAINEMQSKWQERISNAESQEKQAEIRQEANEAVTGTIEDSGLSPKEYNQIYQAARQDQELYEDLMTRIEDERSG